MVRYRAWISMFAGLAFVAVGILGIVGVFQHSEPVTLRFEPLNHDFGKLRGHEKYSATFYAINQSRIPMTDLSIVPSCGCTTVAEIPPHINGGFRIPIDVQFDTGHLQGKIRKPITVHWKSNGQQNSETIFLSGFVQPRFVHEPRTIEFDHDVSGIVLVTVTSAINNERAPEIKAISANTNAIKCLIHTTATNPPKVTIEVSYDPMAPPKLHRKSAAVGITMNDSHQTKLELPVRFISNRGSR